MRRALAVFGLCASLSAAAATMALLPNASEASATQATFLVPAHDGYGVAECLTSGSDCGHVVANTWCEAQGYARAVSFRQTDGAEATGSIQKAALAPKHAPIEITCSN
ncbi:hypothetical protein [Microvirga pudoricolor]|uniref:hypothetical protein n=1 Tax=Microvirga pudoricolor TaxID=2778729 RepID=UPI00194EA32E|nr:hypothetical protein [Microvirga pudoricolor]MBM6594462.1 hypothetical protein [Microvirga pudoricolor]